RDDPCADAIYSNGPYQTGRFGLEASRSPSRTFGVVDDVYFAHAVTITGLTWFTMDDFWFDWSGTVDVMVFLPDGPAGEPNTQIVDRRDLTCTRTLVDDTVHGRHVHRYDLSGLDLELTGGDYFVGVRPVQKTSSPEFSYWLTVPAQHSPVYVNDGNG